MLRYPFEISTRPGAEGRNMKSVSKLLISSRANFEPYGISPLGLKFKQQDEEAEYQTFILRTSLAHIRFSLSVALIIIAAYAFLDPFIYEGADSLIFAYLIRFLVIFPPALAVVLATFHYRYPEYSQFLSVFVIVTIGIGWFFFAYKTDMNGVIDNFSSIIMTSSYGFFFSGLFFRYGFTAGAFINALYSFAIWSVDLPPAMGISVNISMIVIFLLLAMAAYQKELISRQLFVTEKRERATLARKSQRDSRYLGWLRMLASFLRHEVRQPVAQINSSIELIQLISQQDQQLKTYLASAAFGAQHVWNLIERASRATDAEAFVRQGQAQWINLDLLLSDLVASYQQTYSGLEFHLEGRESSSVYADPTLIKEAVGNLLSNAASYAEEESTVEVALEVDETVAVIKVCNKGPLIEGDSEGLFGPFATTRSGPSSIHQGLGLYLVRLIAEEHGGTATLSNLEDGTGVQASILLPLPRDQHRPPSDSRELAPT